MINIKLPKEISYKNHIFVLPKEINEIDPHAEAYFILDFDRKFEDPDLNKRPVQVAYVHNHQDKYLLNKYHVILGSLSEL
ncbi:hypothetical protein [Marinicrinis sediminis]|uniref:Uncharacterized protein n=1 Tax=Marinicrinis sediminis TaxID=1652465 RepID=A0ABW5R7Z5_9BACL